MRNCRASDRGYAALIIVTLIAAALAASSVLAFVYRQDLREGYRRWRQGPMPAELSAAEARKLAPPAPSPVPSQSEGEVETPADATTTGAEASVTGQNEAEAETELVEPETPTDEPAVNPSALPAGRQGASGSWPKEINLAVPMIYQAPFQIWDAVDEDACEEASILMVQAFYRGERSLTREEMRRRIDEIIAYEKRTLGFFESTTAAETVDVMVQFLGLENVRVLPVTSPDDIRRQLAAGRPVILPCDGKRLENPNFRNGGPLYHMLVVKGYKPASTAGRPGWFITQDPGTRKGENYLYDENILTNAIHDWNGGDVPHGAKVMIVVE